MGKNDQEAAKQSPRHKNIPKILLPGRQQLEVDFPENARRIRRKSSDDDLLSLFQPIFITGASDSTAERPANSPEVKSKENRFYLPPLPQSRFLVAQACLQRSVSDPNLHRVEKMHRMEQTFPTVPQSPCGLMVPGLSPRAFSDPCGVHDSGTSPATTQDEKGHAAEGMFRFPSLPAARSLIAQGHHHRRSSCEVPLPEGWQQTKAP